MNVLLVGGTGFVGRAMQEHAPDGAQVSLYTRRVGTLDGDWTHIVNLVAHSTPDSDIAITQVVADRARRLGARLLVASSGAAGERNVYGATCALKEAISEGAIIARLYSFISRDLPTNHAIRQFFDSASRGESVVVTGSGDTVRSYLHASEMAERMWDLLEHGDPCIHEVGSCVPTTIRELADEVAARYGVGVRVLHGDDGPRKVYLPRIGVVPRISLHDALLREAASDCI